MLTKKLEKKVSLYRNQFEKFTLQLFGDYRLSRLGLDLDAILFRIKYMNKHNKDVDKIPSYEEEFTNKASEMRSYFSKFMYQFLCDIITIPEPFHVDDIIDVFTSNVKMDSSYVTFTMTLISSNEDYLKYVDGSFKDGETINMYPNEYFRFTTDSYNDGIAKAYPELFENRKQNKIGVGDDADIFVHNVTLQTSERCSLNCSYCVSGDTFIQTPNANVKKIKDLKVGDIVIGFSEREKHNHSKYDDMNLSDYEVNKIIRFNERQQMLEGKKVYHHKTFYNAEVLNVFKHEAETVLIKSPYLKEPLRITPNHKVLTENGWMAVDDLNPEKIKVGFRYGNKILYTSSYLVYNDHEVIDVYNIETTTGTYIAAGMCVHNCYQFNKSEMRMSFDTAKEFIDHIVNDDYGYVNQYNSPALILEFIGGEPLLEINLTRKIYEYFLERCYELNHPWFTMHRLSLCSNGMQYFDEEVQEFFNDYSSQISFNISIDGNKELHDACRVQPNGEGSYDIDMCALNHFNKYHTPERNSKMTLSPDNITYLFDSVVDFIKNGMKVININCIFEEGWNNETALIEYNQLKKLADYILENNLENIYIAVFTDKQESRLGKDMDGNFCGGGTASMLAVRPNGQFYPCLRFMPSSVGPNVDDLCIGTVKDGLVGREDHSEIIDMLDHITRRSQTNDICWECPIASNCANCSALGSTVFGTPNKRTTFICIQHIAEHLANVYYWNLAKIKHPEWNLQSRRLMVPDGWALSIIDKDELELLKYLEIKNTLDDYEKIINITK